MLKCISVLLLLAVLTPAISVAANKAPSTVEERLDFINKLEASFEHDIATDKTLTPEQIQEMHDWIAYLRERETWPHTVSEAVKNILSTLPSEDRVTIKATARNELVQLNDSWGMGIRNAFGLWKGNPELAESACGKGCEPEKVSIVIMEAVWDELQKEQGAK